MSIFCLHFFAERVVNCDYQPSEGLKPSEGFYLFVELSNSSEYGRQARMLVSPSYWIIGGSIIPDWQKIKGPKRTLYKKKLIHL
jgi:hypothetical protein